MNAGFSLGRLVTGVVGGTIGSLGVISAPMTAISLAAVAGLASVAPAQVKDAAPYWAVVTADNAPLRSGEIQGAYRVAELPKGQVVRVDGESGNMARVLYPAKITVFLKISDSPQPPQVDTAAGTVRLAQATKLRAANAAGFEPSWMLLRKEPYPEGTTLKLVETMKADDGTLAGYRLSAPDGSRGFVEQSSLRRATDAEIAAHEKSIGAPASKPEPKAEPAPAPKPAEAKPTTPEATPPADNSLLKPMTPAGQQPATTPSNTEPTTTPPVTPAPAPEAVPVVEHKTTPAVQPKPVERTVGTLETLESSFQKVRSEPLMEAEFDALIAEFERSINSTDKTKYPRRYGQLVARRDYLRLRVDSRDQMRVIEEAKQRADNARSQSVQRLAELEAQRVYTVVGQLLPSNVYDGKDLPLMYRLQSVGGVVPRTLGYLKPQERLQIPTKLGMVVGVIGQATLDPSLRLNIFDAVRVDVLKAADTVPPASNSAPPESLPENPVPTQPETPPSAGAGEGEPESDPQ